MIETRQPAIRKYVDFVKEYATGDPNPEVDTRDTLKVSRYMVLGAKLLPADSVEFAILDTGLRDDIEGSTAYDIRIKFRGMVVVGCSYLTDNEKGILLGSEGGNYIHTEPAAEFAVKLEENIRMLDSQDRLHKMSA